MCRIELCHEVLEHIEVHFSASLTFGQLEISGHDVGKRVADIWGSYGYEYFYCLSISETNKLYNLLKHDGENDLLQLLKSYFSGIDGCKKFRNFCEEHEIKYQTFTY